MRETVVGKRLNAMYVMTLAKFLKFIALVESLLKLTRLD